MFDPKQNNVISSITTKHHDHTSSTSVSSIDLVLINNTKTKNNHGKTLTEEPCIRRINEGNNKSQIWTTLSITKKIMTNKPE